MKGKPKQSRPEAKQQITVLYCCKAFHPVAQVINFEAAQVKYKNSKHQIKFGHQSYPAVTKFNDGLTNTSWCLCSEALLTLTYKAARSVHTHISQFAATLLLKAALIHV